jgi:hypothetical protein
MSDRAVIRDIATAPSWSRARRSERIPREDPSGIVPANDTASAIRLLCEGMIAEIHEIANEADLRAERFADASADPHLQEHVVALRSVARVIRDTASRIRFEIDLPGRG